MVGKLWKGAKDTLAGLTDASEQSTRLGHYLEAKRYFQAKNAHWSPEDVNMAAAFEARDTLDFSRRGSSPFVRQLRANVPFIGAGTEGTRRAMEAMLENPLRFVVAGLALQTAPELINLTLNRDDPDYWQIPQEKRDKFFMVRNPFWDGKNPDWKFIPIPRVKDGLVPSFSRIPEWIAQAAKGDKTPLGERAVQMASTLSQDVLPGNLDATSPRSFFNLAGPVIGATAEAVANRDFYRQRDIVPAGVRRQNPSPRLQAGPGTSVLSRFIANHIPGGQVSPMMIDHVLNRLGAGTGQLAINWVVDPLLSKATGSIPHMGPFIPQSERRSAGTAGEGYADMMRVRYKPYRFESWNRFDSKLEDLKAAKNEWDNAQADSQDKKVFPQMPELTQMKASDSRVHTWSKHLMTEKDPEKRAELQMQIREETSKYAPAPGARP